MGINAGDNWNVPSSDDSQMRAWDNVAGGDGTHDYPLKDVKGNDARDDDDKTGDAKQDNRVNN